MQTFKSIIIEDEKEYIDILKFYLKKIEGIEILNEYGDTVSAALEIERQKPDLIFLDINISGLDGPEFVDLLIHRPKIIIVSSHPESIMKSDFPDVDYDGYLQKPVDLEKLKAVIEKL
ncbi:MAG: response regulator [Cyclobacteriaceae bacterium]